jgi:hypothetical protein
LTKIYGIWHPAPPAPMIGNARSTRWPGKQ